MRKFIITTLLCIFTCVPEIICQSRSGCALYPIQDIFQNWYYVDNGEPAATITGTISKVIHHNVGGIFDDGDWWIYIRPDDPRYLVNSDGDANEDGMIECEIHTRGKPSNLRYLFPVGTRVEAYGDWVEDSGHGDKTELHPLYYLKMINTNQTNIFMGQDDSGRFINASSPNYQHFIFPISISPQLARPGYIPPSRTSIFHQSGTIARGTTMGVITPEGYTSWVFLDKWYFSDCELKGRVYYGDSPYFISTVRESIEQLLSDNIRYSVSTDISTGIKIANLKVSIEVLDKPDFPMQEVEWTFESSAGVIGTSTVKQENPPFKLEFTMPYCPALDYNQNSWLVTMVGSNTALDSRFPEESEEFEKGFNRKYYTETRRYELPASEVSLDFTKKGGNCGEVIYITVNEEKLLDEIKLRNLQWYISIIRDENGFTIDNPQEILLDPLNPFENNGLKANCYHRQNFDEERLDIHWKNLSSGLDNLIKVRVIAKGVTEIGENIVAASDFSPLCGVGAYSISQIWEAYNDILKSKRYKDEIYKITPKKRHESWMNAFNKALTEQRLEKEEREIILKHLKKYEQKKEFKYDSIERKKPIPLKKHGLSKLPKTAPFERK